MKTLTELGGDVSMTSWIPADYYADLILEASLCYGQLSGVITAVAHDAAQGCGGIVQVRYVPARTAQGPFYSCHGTTGLTAASTTLGSYSIDIAALGDYERLCGYSLWKAQGPVKDKILNEMAKGLAKKRDQDIITALKGATIKYKATTTYGCYASAATSESTYCCANVYAKSLYNSIVSVAQSMKGGGYNPDVLIINPTVSKFFYYKDYVYENGFQTKYDEKGTLTMLHGLKVIECCNMTACTAVSATTMAFVIDSSRAVGEAWGKRPTFEEERVGQLDSYDEFIWMYWGCAHLEDAAVGSVVNK